MKNLENIEYKNTFVEQFPGDLSGNPQPRLTEKVLYALVKPSSVETPRILSWSDDLGKQLDLAHPSTQGQVDHLVGNRLTLGMLPYASCYGGHQFGFWANQLGDGRAITLGEIHETNYGAIAELQLKGAGITPYSRRGDGKAVLRSSVREYLMSEAMHHLGIPTTRALSLCTTGDQVWRDLFYDGHPRLEPGAIVCRVAPSFLRFGHFELLSAREEFQTLYQLIEWTINHFYSEINEQGLKGDERLKKFFEIVALKTADLIVQWMRVGFCHGVMNTDNMSILGLTIDYGPFSILDEYHPMFTPNTTDLPGRRYAFSRQAGVALWNLERLAEALTPMLSSDTSFDSTIKLFPKYFSEQFYQMMAKKFGMSYIHDDFPEILAKWSSLMSDLQIDYNLFFCAFEDDIDIESVSYRAWNSVEKNSFNGVLKELSHLQDREGKSSKERVSLMKANNPRFVLKNFILKEIADQLEKGDQDGLKKIEKLCLSPYLNHAENLMRPTDVGLETGHTLLSCSS